MSLCVTNSYSHLSNNRGGWNKRGGGAKAAKSINVEGGIFWKKPRGCLIIIWTGLNIKIGIVQKVYE